MTKLSTLILILGLACLASAEIQLTDPFMMSITLNQKANTTSKNVTTYSL